MAPVQLGIILNISLCDWVPVVGIILPIYQIPGLGYYPVKGNFGVIPQGKENFEPGGI